MSRLAPSVGSPYTGPILGRCDVWVARPCEVPLSVDRLLSPLEIARRDRYRNRIDQRRSAVGAAMVRTLLGLATGEDPSAVEVDRACQCGEHHGRPRLASRPDAVPVSLSHAGDVVVAAVTRGVRVGVDVEPLQHREGGRVVPMRVLAPAEQAQLRSSAESGLEETDDWGRFLRYWTCKEAIVKATGDGITVPLEDIVIDWRDGRPHVADWRGKPERAPRITLHNVEAVAGHAVVVALLDAPGLQVQVFAAADGLPGFSPEPSRAAGAT